MEPHNIRRIHPRPHPLIRDRQQREDMKHAVVKMLCGQLYFAPIGNHPHEILDIGTGTGIWAIESMLIAGEPCDDSTDRLAQWATSSRVPIS